MKNNFRYSLLSYEMRATQGGGDDVSQGAASLTAANMHRGFAKYYHLMRFGFTPCTDTVMLYSKKKAGSILPASENS